MLQMSGSLMNQRGSFALCVCVLMQDCVHVHANASVSDQPDGQSFLPAICQCVLCWLLEDISVSTELFMEVVCQVSTYQRRHHSYVTSLPQITLQLFVALSMLSYMIAGYKGR